MKVGDVLEQCGPVRAHLLDPLKCTRGEQRLLAAVVLVEAGEHALEVVSVLRSGQPVYHGARVAHPREHTPRLWVRQRPRPLRAALVLRGDGAAGAACRRWPGTTAMRD